MLDLDVKMVEVPIAYILGLGIANPPSQANSKDAIVVRTCKDMEDHCMFVDIADNKTSS